MSTVSIGSNKKYADNWEAIFKKGKSTKKQAPAHTQSKKEAATKKKGKAAKSTARSRKRKS